MDKLEKTDAKNYNSVEAHNNLIKTNKRVYLNISKRVTAFDTVIKGPGVG